MKFRSIIAIAVLFFAGFAHAGDVPVGAGHPLGTVHYGDVANFARTYGLNEDLYGPSGVSKPVVWLESRIVDYHAKPEEWKAFYKIGSPFEETVTANQPGADNGIPKFDGNDYYASKDYMTDSDPSSDPPNVPYFDTTSANGALGPIPGISPTIASLANSSTYKIIITDSSSKSIFTYPGAPTAAENYGSEKLTDGNMETDPTNNWIISIPEPAELFEEAVIIHGGTKALKIGANANNGHAYQNIAVSEGEAYLVEGWARGEIAGHRFGIAVRDNTNNAFISNYTYQDSITYTGISKYFTVPPGCVQIAIRLASEASGETVYYDDIRLRQVANIGTGGVSAYTTAAKTTYGFGGDTSNFNFNDALGYTIRAEDAALSITKDFWISTIINPIDGQPAAGVYFGSKITAGSFIGYGLKLETSGKISLIGSSDGTTVEGITTDNAIFDDGSNKRTLISGVYNSNTSTGKIYVNGKEVSTSNLAGGGFSSSTYDIASSFQIGAESTPGGYMGNGSTMEYFSLVPAHPKDEEIKVHYLNAKSLYNLK